MWPFSRKAATAPSPAAQQAVRIPIPADHVENVLCLIDASNKAAPYNLHEEWLLWSYVSRVVPEVARQADNKWGLCQSGPLRVFVERVAPLAPGTANEGSC